ncbi:GPW/gp25 family protein [Hyphomicrobium sp.]|uniref:GPW/gp25 family protein n=1 Tax=Hyphomicrobium sp. TaxID=82 RepID=UPI001D559ABC|nr:GPW/gp25 family protein [Hyphomicrobium sp.]MBY0559873.1 GPW/gp25 family protein [Hyphomicrobium sp.]
MADSRGLNRLTGHVISDWDDVSQSIKDILTTPVGTRVLRRDYGSRVPDLLDHPANPDTILDFTFAVAEALAWEPRVKFLSLDFSAGADGHITFVVEVIYLRTGLTNYVYVVV